MDWTFWLGLIAIATLWVVIWWVNGAWRRRAERAHRRRLEATGATAPGEGGRTAAIYEHEIRSEQRGPWQGIDPPNG